MKKHYYICYEEIDNNGFAEKLCGAIRNLDIPFEPWIDIDYSSDTEDFYDFIEKAVKNSDGLIFILTPESAKSRNCKKEWQYALVNLKPIIPIRVDTYSELPLRLASREPVDFTIGFEIGLKKLIKKMIWLHTKEGVSETLELAISDARQALRSPDANKILLEEKIKNIKVAIENLKLKSAEIDEQAKKVFSKHVFISYSLKDSVMMKEIKRILMNRGVKIWNDEKVEQGTEDWAKEIQLAIEQSACVVCLLSPDAKDSKWVNRELSYAEIQDIRVFPILIRGDETDAVPIRLVSYQRTNINSNQDIEMQLDKTLSDIAFHLAKIKDVEFAY